MTKQKGEIEEVSTTERKDVTGGVDTNAGVVNNNVGAAVDNGVGGVVPEVARPVQPVTPVVRNPFTGKPPGAR